ncbi:MAG TPA: class D beta-lactamase [Mesorhizobium sp.]
MKQHGVRKAGMGLVSNLWLGVLALLLCASTMGKASAQTGKFECTLIADAATAQPLLRDGVCDRPVSPASTFKLPLAAMGFDAGILTGETAPAWKYRTEFDAPKRDHKTVDPAIWERDSVLWYSRELTRRLGEERFAAYVAKFGYGNADVSGDPGQRNGLSHSWLSSSLLISADQQAEFIRRLLADQLPVSAKAAALTRAVVPSFPAGDGWTVHGKTGSIFMRGRNGKFDRARPIGWFVGWADKGGRRVIFARLLVDDKRSDEPLGRKERQRIIEAFPRLMKQADRV